MEKSGRRAAIEFRTARGPSLGSSLGYSVSMHRTVASLSLTLIALLPGCLATAPKLVVQASHGVVRADSVGQARTVAGLLDALAPRVRALLPDTKDDEVEIWVQRELSLYTHWSVDQDVPAFTLEGKRRIHLAENSYRELSSALAHELVHALLGKGWESLPPVAEEGLADWVQEALHPELSASMRADHLSKASAAFGGMRFGLWCSRSIQGGRQLASFTFPGPIDGQELITDPERAIDAGTTPSGKLSGWRPYEVSVTDPRLYGIGYLTVARAIERVGLDGLYDLCRRASGQGLGRVPGAWLLEAAELSREPDHWRMVIVSRIGRNELKALGHSLAPFLADLLSRELPASTHASGAKSFLARYRPRLGLEHGVVRLPLSWLRELQRVLEGGHTRNHPRAASPRDVAVAVP